ncbi:thiopeptide-type bacteriocin biosynthesis domain-containing protein [Actinopolyspora alba]|uniref:Thiopeptide-type bacteriocin biosynthesis domain-containing protein n=1 Tax=Actinopolyspora alba TaxID=673379 RepID=A0A1I2C812_9ACTN|nr:lantibiotic dehydratase [Actinopolyspora alba]SFE63820.1 thiopeptide-type bacteriocin biosynthesis domain-containing protein [Actinopolyspora alba]
MTYACADAALLRVSAQSSTEPLPPWPDLSGSSSEPLRRWLHAVWHQDGIAETIAEASPVLADRVRQLLDGRQRESRDIRRVVLAVTRYVLRARSRATPFGLFAGIAPAHAGSVTNLHWGGDHRAHARVEAGWIDHVITSLERCRELRWRLRVMATNLAEVRDDRLVITHQPHPAHEGPTEISMRHTRAVDTALRTADTPVPVTALTARLAHEFPRTSLSVIEHVVDELIEQRVLISNLRPPMTSTDPVSYVVAELDTLDAAELPEETAELIHELRAVRADLARHNATTPPADPGALRNSLSTRMSTLAPIDKPVMVDLRTDCSVSLADPVWREAESAVDVLTRLSPHPQGTPEWADYHHRFLERYGLGAHVPVRDLLEPDTGLGYPAGYRGSLLTVGQQGVSERDARLLALAQRAALDQHREIHLDENTVSALATPSENLRPRPHCELSFRVHAASPAAIDRGEFELAVAGISRTAGTLTGRFLDMLTEPERRRLMETYTRLPTLNREALPVQLSCPPLQTRTHNVARSPGVLGEVLSLGEHRVNRIAVDDLAVTGDLDRLYLVSLTHGQVVEPIVVNAVEFTHHTHPLARFLTEIATARSPILGPFGWGHAAGQLAYLPRVRYRHSILTPAQWSLTSRDLPPNADGSQWPEALAAWRDRCHVADEVYLGDGDQRLHLNLDEPTHQQLLRTELDRSGDLTLREAPPPGAFDWIDGRAHDIVVPLASTAGPASGPAARTRSPDIVHGREHGHLPGAGTWLYAQLHCHPDRQTPILTKHLPRLLDQWNTPPEWWFLRYADPHPHLRLRIRLNHPDEFGTAATRVGTWADDLRQRGLLSGMTLETYRPETGRFGGGEAMRAAESVFAADSAAALAQLEHTQAGTADEAITAASMVDLVISYLSSTECGARWLIEHVPRTHTPAPDRQVRDQAVDLANPHNGWAALCGIPGGEAIAASWQRRQQALAVYRDTITSAEGTTPTAVLRDFLHLHHARVTGIDPDHERQCLHLARAAALSITSRRDRGAA